MPLSTFGALGGEDGRSAARRREGIEEEREREGEEKRGDGLLNK